MRNTRLPVTPKGRPGMSDVSPLSGISGLSFDSTLLFPLLFFCLVLLIFLSYLFSACWFILLNFFQKILQYFSVRDRLFCMACLAARRSRWLCSKLPHGTGICYYAFIYCLPFFIASVHSFFYTLKKIHIDKSTERSTIQACP